ncbi:MAG TPA: hypothetical protein VND92_02400 [Vicinamibacterales bacterium]|nr:hypothetical protein [Vicinamibacterales bacterium]
MSKRKPATAPRRTATDDAYATLAADFCDLLRTLAPSDEAMNHFRAARLEALKGLRAIIDSRIASRSAERPKGRSVKID